MNMQAQGLNEATAQPVNTGPSISMAMDPVEAAQKKREETQVSIDKAFEDYLKAMEELLSPANFVSPKIRAAYAVLNTSALSAERREVEINGQKSNKLVAIVLNDKNAEKKIFVSPTAIQYVSNAPQKDFTMDDALKMAWAASQNADLLKKGIVLGGTDAQKKMLQKAVNAVNQHLPDGQKLAVQNPVRVWLSPRADFNRFVANNTAGVEVPELETTEDLTADIDSMVIPAAAEPAAPAPAAPAPEAAAGKPAMTPEEKSAAMLDYMTERLSEGDLEKLRSDLPLYERRGSNKGHNVYKISEAGTKSQTGSPVAIDTYYVFKNNKPLAIMVTVDDKVEALHPDIRLKKMPEKVAKKAQETVIPTNVQSAPTKKPVVQFSYLKPVDVGVSVVSYGKMEGIAKPFEGAAVPDFSNVGAITKPAPLILTQNQRVNAPKPTI